MALVAALAAVRIMANKPGVTKTELDNALEAAEEQVLQQLGINDGAWNSQLSNVFASIGKLLGLSSSEYATVMRNQNGVVVPLTDAVAHHETSVKSLTSSMANTNTQLSNLSSLVGTASETFLSLFANAARAVTAPTPTIVQACIDLSQQISSLKDEQDAQLARIVTIE